MTETNPAAPTVALVHGAFADAGSWGPVAERLLAAGIQVRNLANPLRGLTADSAYIASAIAQIPGSVLAVGHSYGGAVITNAASQAGNVVGLVYVAGFAPAQNETLGDIEGTSRDSVLASALVQAQYPLGPADQISVELYVNPASFHEVFARDLPAEQAAVLAASQRPIAASAFEEKSGVAAWETLPTWAVVATGDKAAGADVILSMAKRANAEITELDGSHVIMISRPDPVADVILKALQAIG